MKRIVELKVVMEGIPIAAVAANLATEVQAMLQKEYAEGVRVFVSETDPQGLKDRPQLPPEKNAGQPTEDDKAAVVLDLGAGK